MYNVYYFLNSMYFWEVTGVHLHCNTCDPCALCYQIQILIRRLTGSLDLINQTQTTYVDHIAFPCLTMYQAPLIESGLCHAKRSLNSEKFVSYQKKDACAIHTPNNILVRHTLSKNRCHTNMCQSFFWYNNQWRPLHEHEYSFVSPCFSKVYSFTEQLSSRAFQRYMTLLYCSKIRVPYTIRKLPSSPLH